MGLSQLSLSTVNGRRWELNRIMRSIGGNKEKIGADEAQDKAV